MRNNVVKHYQAIALHFACRSVMRHQVGCVIVGRCQREYVGAWNRWLGDPEGRGWSLHAEVWASLRAEEWDIKPTTAFVARHNGRLAKPCVQCIETLEDIGVKTVYYTTAPGEWGVQEIG